MKAIARFGIRCILAVIRFLLLHNLIKGKRATDGILAWRKIYASLS